jgi:hypothetical protein
MKCPRADAHPAPMIIWAFHPAMAGQVVANKNSPARAGRTKNKHMKIYHIAQMQKVIAFSYYLLCWMQVLTMEW